jgi:hypothetical protein
MNSMNPLLIPKSIESCLSHVTSSREYPKSIFDRKTGLHLPQHPFSRFPTFDTQNSAECDYGLTPGLTQLKREP